VLNVNVEAMEIKVVLLDGNIKELKEVVVFPVHY
jgi:hypothetical protein